VITPTILAGRSEHAPRGAKTSLKIAETVSHYRILTKLGQGGMGVVFKAQDLRLDRPVALKFLPAHLRADAAASERFVQEARTASALDHPNICTIYEIDETPDGQMFIAMAYYGGEPLNQTIARGPLPILEAVDVAVQVARGLARAHAKGIVHRDIKSGNVIVTQDRQVKIVDFGLARLLGASLVTTAGSTAGTIAYMSPEQARGEPVDRRADLWSLAAVLYEMVTGELPFKGGHPQAVLHAILSGNRRPMGSLVPGVPEALERIVDQAFATKIEERFQDADQVLSRLVALRGDLTDPQPITREYPIPAGRKRDASGGRRFVIALAALAPLIAGVVLWRSRSPPGERVPPGPTTTTVAVLPFSYRGSEEYRYLGEGIIDLLSAKLDGAGAVRSIDPRAIVGLASGKRGQPFDPESGQRAADGLGAGRYVLGSIVEVGGRLQIDAALYETQGRTVVAKAAKQGQVSQTFDLVDQLALGLLAGLGEGSSGRIDRAAAVTTSSLPALKAYLDGENAFQRGDFQSSVEAFQRAVRLDSGFALAWYRLSIALEWKGTPQELQQNAAEQAYRNADRLTRRERKLLEALRVWRDGRSKEAKQLYLAIVREYPDEIEGWYQLGEVLFHRNGLYGMSFVESRDAFERVLALEPRHFASMIHLARIEAFVGQTREADALIDRFLGLSREAQDRNLEIRALRAFYAPGRGGDKDAVLAELQHADGASLGMTFTEVSLYGRNLQGAEQIARIMAAPSHRPTVQSFGHVAIAHIRLAQGRWSEARRELSVLSQVDPWAAQEYRALFAGLPFLPVSQGELAEIKDGLERLDPKAILRPEDPSVFIDTHRDIHPLIRRYLLAVVSARMGELGRGDQMVSEMKSGEYSTEYRGLATDLTLAAQAQLDRARGKPAEALAELERVPSETKNPLESPILALAYERFTRGQLLFEAGRYQEASVWFDHIAESSVFEFVYSPVAHLWLGEICEKLGQSKEAADHYARFIDAWQGCDEALRPMVELARRKVPVATQR
jgi:serine/threonine protein kinase/tetratricopeptide (TPR) repeat protein